MARRRTWPNVHVVAAAVSILTRYTQCLSLAKYVSRICALQAPDSPGGFGGALDPADFSSGPHVTGEPRCRVDIPALPRIPAELLESACCSIADDLSK